MKGSSRVLGVIAVLSLLSLWLLRRSLLPLGIPGEWTWPRLPSDDFFVSNLVVAGLAAGLYLAFVAIGSHRLAGTARSGGETAAWLLGLVIAAGLWLCVVQETAPTAGQLAKAPFVLYYPSSSGYFYHARYKSPDAEAFLREYEALMEQGDVLHVGTHPPGLFLLFHGLMAVQKAWPAATAGIGSWAPASFQDAMEIVRENTSQTPHPASTQDGDVLWMATLLAIGCAAATTATLWGIARLTLSPGDSWLLAAIWPMLPAIAIFLPKSDAAYPLVSSLIVLTAGWSWRRNSLPLAFLAGCCLWLGLVLSLAFLPVAAFVGLAVLLDGLRRTMADRQQWATEVRRFVLWSVAWGLGLGLALLLFSWWGELNLFNVWMWNYRNHAGFYREFPRSWLEWLLVNPLELSLAVGAPVILLATWGLTGLRSNLTAWKEEQVAALAVVVLWGLLWISGKNSGEAARLWLLFCPAVVWLAGRQLAAWRASLPQDPRPIWMVLAIQMAVCIVTVHSVGGFHLATPQG